MRVFVVAHCMTPGYVGMLQALFPDWEVKGVSIEVAVDWLTKNNRPDFNDYVRSADLYLGDEVRDPLLAAALNPTAQRIILPMCYFRGLHPDVCVLADFRGPLSTRLANGICSLIAVAARALNLNVADTAALFRDETYAALGYFELYAAEKRRLIDDFQRHGVDLTEEFAGWEQTGDFYHVPHHPRPFVMADIIRRTMHTHGFLDASAYAGSLALSRAQHDYLGEAERWPVYPELAARLGFAGKLIWRRPRTSEADGLRLEGFLEATFAALDAAPGLWKDQSFVTRAAAVIRHDILRRVPAASTDTPDERPAEAPRDPFDGLGEQERARVDAARAAPYDESALFRACEALRNAGAVAALDALVAQAPSAARFDSAVMGVWAFAAIMRQDWPEAMRRAQLMLSIHPAHGHGRSWVLHATYHLGGYPAMLSQAEAWLAEPAPNADVAGTAAQFASGAQDWPTAARLWRELDRRERGGAGPVQLRNLVEALRKQNMVSDAQEVLARAKEKFPADAALAALA